MSWNARQEAVQSMLREVFPRASFHWWRSWNVSGEPGGKRIFVMDCTEQHIGGPPDDMAVSWSVIGGEARGYISDRLLPAPPREPDSQWVKNARICSGIDPAHAGY